MDGAYSFDLLVKIEDNNIPKLKNKLFKYFLSKKSNGGDCEIEYENCSGTALLRFRTQEGALGFQFDFKKSHLKSFFF